MPLNDQTSLFDEPDAQDDGECPPPDAVVQTITYNRRTHKQKRADLLVDFPAEEFHHESTEIDAYPVRLHNFPY